MKTLVKITALAAVSLIFSCSGDQAPPVAETGIVPDSTSVIEKEAESKQAFLNSYQSLKKNASEKLTFENKDQVWMMHEMFKVWAEHLNDYKTTTDADIKAVYSDYKQTLINLQVKMYPQMRKAYLGEAKQALFRHNVDVHSSKPSYSMVEFTGYLFANNANIEDVNNMVWQQLNDLRFKEVRYSWSDYDDKYTYYNIKSPSDKAIVF